MRILIQKVSKASVRVEDKVSGEINEGLCLFVGVEDADEETDVDWLVKKTSMMRLFEDEAGVMNRSLLDVGGEVLIISQFTLHASTKKGNRPSYIKAARPEKAIPLYESFIKKMKAAIGADKVSTGIFGADMKVEIHNNGPVTIWIDSKNRE